MQLPMSPFFGLFLRDQPGSGFIHLILLSWARLKLNVQQQPVKENATKTQPVTIKKKALFVLYSNIEKKNKKHVCRYEL